MSGRYKIAATHNRALAPLAWLVCLIACGCVGSCVTGPPASPSQSYCQPTLEGVPDPSAKRRPSAPGALLFPIRLTDDGEFVKRCELTDALQELRAPGAQLAVIYIHGWKHDARPDDTDRGHFRDLLASLQVSEGRTSHPRRVVGVYIAWNGQRSDLPVFNNLTFWSRKKAADLVAQSAMVTKIISAIDGVQTKRRAANPALADFTVYIGHSFGARMLYSAVSQVLIHQVELAFPDTMRGTGNADLNAPLPALYEYHRIAGMGDLVLLLNPAFEASFYQAFQTLIRPAAYGRPDVTREKFAADQAPIMLTLAATTDLATKIAFPLGQAVALNGSRIRRTTLGNYDPAWTHTVTHGVAPPGANGVPTYWFDNFCADSVCLERKEEIAATGDPFIVARAPPSIMKGHSGIWGAQLQGFLVSFISEAIRRRDVSHQ